MTDGEYSDFFSDESSSDDLEDILNNSRVKSPNYIDNVVSQYSNKEFFEHFRLDRIIVGNLIERYEKSAFYTHYYGGYGQISAANQILIFLWYVGHQMASFRNVSGRFNITISTLHKIIVRVTQFLSNLSREIILWPNAEEKENIVAYFEGNNFPNIIGVIGSCHIKIDKPDVDPEEYINEKGYYSIQMQAVCDHRGKILDVCIGYPGSVLYSTVFRNSNLGENLAEKCGGYFILGGSGYPLRNNLLTPYKDNGNLTERQINYNNKLAANRYIIEQCFGILKQKFGQLYHVKLRNIRVIVHLIRAACVLHNLGLTDEFEMNEPPPINNINNDFDIEPSDEEEEEVENVNIVRDRIANELNM